MFVSIWVEKKFPLCSVNSNAFVLFFQFIFHGNIFLTILKTPTFSPPLLINIISLCKQLLVLQCGI